MNERPSQAWAGIDIGKTHHWISVIDPAGQVLWSARVDNDETAITDTIGDALRTAGQVSWAVDIVGTNSALILTLLDRARQRVHYASGRTVAAMTPAFAGEGKTDAKDAYVIAQTVRMRPDLPTVSLGDELIRQLQVLTAHRSDLVADRVLGINRLRDLLTSVAPALERAFNLRNHKGALLLLSAYPTPDRIRRLGQARLTSWLQKRRVRAAAQVAQTAVDAACAQPTPLPGQEVAAGIIAELAQTILDLDTRLKELEAQIADVFRAHRHAASIESMPGFGPVLGAMLLAAAGDLGSFPDGGHLAAAAGLVPVPNDSGKRSGNLHRPRHYSRTLRHALYLSAQTSIVRAGPNQDFYRKKRDTGHTHTQAVIALARRRTDVLWALIRDGRTFTIEPPKSLPQAA